MDEDLSPTEWLELEQEASKMDEKKNTASQEGRYALALEYAKRELAIRQRLHRDCVDKGGHPDLAKSLNDVGFVLQTLGQYDQALQHLSDALAMRRRLFPKDQFPNGHLDLANSLNNMGSLLNVAGQPERARPYYFDALEMFRQLYPSARFPDGHPDLATSLNNIGSVLRTLGRPREALPFYEEALAMRRRLFPATQFPDGHPAVARSLNNLGFTLQELGQLEKALRYYDEALAMRRRLFPKTRFPDGHPDLANSLNNMGFVFQPLGQPERALPYYDEALAMRHRLFPESQSQGGHPDVADSCNNIGFVLYSLGQLKQALLHFRNALEIRKRLFPNDQFPRGHPDLADSFNNIGFVLLALKRQDESLPHFHAALEMRRQLFAGEQFPDGHPVLADSLNNMGFVYYSINQLEKALSYYDDAFAMYRRLFPVDQFPDGHPTLARCLNNIGFALLGLDKAHDAAARFEQSLAIRLGNLTRSAHSTPNATTLASLQDLRITAGGLISVLRDNQEGLAAAYASLWKMRAPLLTALRTRHTASRAHLAGSVVGEVWEHLIATRVSISRLMTEQPTDIDERDRMLAHLHDETERLEGALARHLPDPTANTSIADTAPRDLATVLPADVAFVDFICYPRWQSGKRAGDNYLGFVIARDRDPIAIDLGNVDPIDSAITAWRTHIEFRHESIAPAQLRELVWDPVARGLPDGIATVYLCPDGNLWRLPFTALPGRINGTVLLDDHALAVVPSGPFLLEQFLSTQASSTIDEVLVIGDIDYGTTATEKEVYPRLPETGREARRVCEAFGLAADRFLGGTKATPEAVTDGLRSARYAHVATHGYFRADAVTEERKRLERFLESWQAGSDPARGRVGIGILNPLGYVGIALAGANGAEADGILTGLGIVDLPLEELRLCVLSACETGLGELTEGEGVAGLQRAFHVAGCPNVVGSLWNVSDKATAALMVQFYHEHRVNKQPVIEALRRAQLTVYRHPNRIDNLAGDRGRLAVEDAARLGPMAPTWNDPKTKVKTSPTKLWAAFVLSGLGR